MKKEIKDLIDITGFYGKNKDYILAGGGNTSYKDAETIYIKASGFYMDNIKEDHFVGLNRKKAQKIMTKEYSRDSIKRELEIKNDLLSSRVHPEKKQRPSVETSVHEIINYAYVVHTHPLIINSLLCSKKAKSLCTQLCKKDVIFIELSESGDIMTKKISSSLKKYYNKKGLHPHVTLIQTHGIFVGGDSIAQIKKIYENIISRISKKIKNKIRIKNLPINDKSGKILEALRVALSGNSNKIFKVRNNTLIKMYNNKNAFKYIASSLTPDDVVYCKAAPCYLEAPKEDDKIISSFRTGINKYKNKWGYHPKVILIKNIGLIGIEEDEKSAENILDVFENLIKVCHFSKNFYGPEFLAKKQIEYIDNWEVENYRRKIAKAF